MYAKCLQQPLRAAAVKLSEIDGKPKEKPGVQLTQKRNLKDHE